MDDVEGVADGARSAGPSAPSALGSLWQRAERSLFPDLTAGLVLGALAVTISISLTALMFGPDLQPFMARTIGMVLAGGIALSLVVGVLTSARGMIAHVQDAPAAVLGALAAAMSVDLAAASREEQWLTTLALVASTTLATGLLYFLVGSFRLGGLVRYLPYPVLGGFMAGTGWLLLTGGIGIMSSIQLHGPGDIAGLFATAALVRWLPGLALAVLLLLLVQRIKHFAVWPATLLAAIGAFYLVMWIRGGDLGSWRQAGLLVGPFPQGGLFQPLSGAELAGIRWDVLATQLPGVATVAFVCLIAVLLNSTGVEQAIGRKVDLNRELRAAGLGNLLGGALVGAPGYQGLSFTVFNHTAGSGGRVATLVAAGVMAATLFFGAGAIQLLPTVVIGGLVAFLGLGFLYDWLVASLARLPLFEYLIMLAILATIMWQGVLPGVGVGLVLTVTMFVISSSRTEAVRYASDLTHLRSRVSRPAAERAVLTAHGHETLIFQLQGFLFFGTATALAERLERHGAGAPHEEPAARRVGRRTSAKARGTAPAQRPAHVVLDFQRVTGIDSSGVASVGGIARAAREAGFELCLSAAPDWMKRRLLAAVGGGSERAPRFFPDLDSALEHCEARTLTRSAERVAGAPSSVDLASFEAAGLDLDALRPYLERRELAAGETLIHQGESSDALFFLVAGQMTARLAAATTEGSDAGPDSLVRPAHANGLRLETMRAGSLLGELAFYRDQPRSAHVTADADATVMVLTAVALQRMHQEQPALAAELHRQVARLMAGRVVHLMRAVETLQR